MIFNLQRETTAIMLCRCVLDNPLIHNELWGGVTRADDQSAHRSGGYLSSHPFQSHPTGAIATVSVFNQSNV